MRIFLLPTILVLLWTHGQSSARYYNEAACSHIADSSKAEACKTEVRTGGSYDLLDTAVATSLPAENTANDRIRSALQDKPVNQIRFSEAGSALEAAGYHLLFGTLLGLVGATSMIVSKGDSGNPLTYISYGCFAVSFGFQIALPFDLIAAGKALKPAGTRELH